MTEIRKPVRAIMVRNLCDSCEEGTMQKVGDTVFSCYPLKYDYQCNVCGAKEVLTGDWPRVEYENESQD